MEGIIKRLLESKSAPQHLPTDIFNIEDRSEEAWDLYADINDAVAGVIKGYDPNIDLDDSGLDSRGSTEGDRTIIYKSLVYRFKSGKQVPISVQERFKIERELKKLITLPEEDDNFEYTVNIELVETSLYVILVRRCKM